MNSSPAAIVGMLDGLSISVSRTSIRFAHTKTRYRRKKYHLTGFQPGHGENIFVFNHIENGMVIYSHEPRLRRDSEKYLSQIPFTVKKQKPPVIRGDYWQPLCMIHFGPGQGVVGRNVFQKLREFRALHELEWGWQAKELEKLSRRERGERIHNQKPNTVADIAAVLAGAGRGNKMWTTEPLPLEENAAVEAAKEVEGEVEGEVEVGKAPEAEALDVGGDQAAQAAQASATSTSAAVKDDQPAPVDEAPQAETSSGAETSGAAAPGALSKVKKEKAKPEEPPKRLHKVTIFWANDADLNWARRWSDNVVHEVGLPDGVKVWRWQTREILSQEEVPEEAAPEEKATEEGEGDEDADGAKAVAKDSEAKEGEGEEKQEPAVEKKPEPEQKKGWFGWLGGKDGGSGQDART